MTPATCDVGWEILNFHSDRQRPFLVREENNWKHSSNTITRFCPRAAQTLTVWVNLIRKFTVRSLSPINLPEVFRLKLMALNTSDNGLLAIDCFPINLQQIKPDEWVIHCVTVNVAAMVQSGGTSLRCRLRWGSAPWHRPSEQNHRHLSMTWGLRHPRGALVHWPLSSDGHIWRRFCCEGQSSGHYQGLHALLSGPTWETDGSLLKHFLNRKTHFGVFNNNYYIFSSIFEKLAWSSYPSILARVNWSILYWAKALYQKRRQLAWTSRTSILC